MFLSRSGLGVCGRPALFVAGLCIGLVFGAGMGCRAPERNQVQSYLEGQIKGPSSMGGGDHRGYQVLVVKAEGRTVDTLGIARTGPDGTFSMTVRAPEEGPYPLTVWSPNREEQLVTTDYVVASGDSGRLELEFPLKGQAVHVQSRENEAMLAYHNTVAQHRRVFQEQLQADSSAASALSRGVRQTSSMLWSLQDTYPDTYASELAAVESLSLLAGWDDSLVVERAQAIPASHPGYVDAAQFAYRATARRQGQGAALDLLATFESQAVSDVKRAGLQAIRVRSFIDSQQTEAARSSAQRLRNEYPRTKWAEWARRVGHELRHLQPATKAPNLRMRTMDGDSLSLRALRGRPVILEYFRPQDEAYHRQLGTRNALYRSTRSDSVAFVSVCVEPDTLLYDAFTRARVFPGQAVIAPGGIEDPMVTTYNVVETPTRVLIDAEGRIVGRYSGVAFFTLQRDLAQLLRTQSKGSEPTASQQSFTKFTTVLP